MPLPKDYKEVKKDSVDDRSAARLAVLSKIRAEIEQIVSRYSISRERGGMGKVEWSDSLIKESEVLKILDKYKTESEDCGKRIEINEVR